VSEHVQTVDNGCYAIEVVVQSQFAVRRLQQHKLHTARTVSQYQLSTSYAEYATMSYCITQMSTITSVLQVRF
jgi:D-serine deaminase-like pyridoxal phosphate-dependent protein